MRRREFIALIGASITWPFAAMAQQLDDMRRIGELMGFPNDAQGQARVTAIRQELLKLGWAIGRNAHIDIRGPPEILVLLRPTRPNLCSSNPTNHRQ